MRRAKLRQPKNLIISHPIRYKDGPAFLAVRTEFQPGITVKEMSEKEKFYEPSFLYDEFFFLSK